MYIEQVSSNQESNFTKLLSLFANQDFYDICFKGFEPTAKGENSAYGSTLVHYESALHF